MEQVDLPPNLQALEEVPADSLHLEFVIELYKEVHSALLLGHASLDLDLCSPNPAPDAS